METIIKRSKYLSLILRHNPDRAGITLDRQGWALVVPLLRSLGWSQRQLDDVVEQNDKKRFEYNDDKSKIRASQGHTVTVDLDYKACVPPDILYHGTASRFLSEIHRLGILPMDRHHVHLTDNFDTAIKVGKRHGKLL